jgi:PncC family amidohydrolase
MAAAVTVGKLLAAAKQTVSIAESSSGGAISARLLAVPGASSFFAGGVVCYSSQSKFKLLGLDRTASAPSATKQHAIELADAARTVLGTEWGIGETGVAGEQCAKNYLNIVTAFSRSIRSVRCIQLLAHCHATAAELPQVPQRTAEEFSQGSQLSPSRVPLV